MSQELGDLDALQSFLEVLPEKIEKNPYDYTIYSQWITLLRAIDDIESVRVAREHMYRVIAVPEDIWAEWIRDELDQPAFVSSLSTSTNDNTRLAAAEAFGTSDYVLPILQLAVGATEAHFKDGQAIWIQYKEYIEHAIEAAGSAGSVDGNVTVLVDLLQAVFIERLGQPHAELDATFALYSQFVTQHRNDAYEQHMVDASRIVSRTRQRCSIRDDCEDDLAKSAGNWEATMSYIAKLVREKAANTKEIRMLYERGLAFSCYSPGAWDEYISFLAGSTDEMRSSLEVARRAVRNCWWSGSLWAQLVHLTYAENGLHAANEVYARAVSTHALEHSMSEFSQLATARITVARLDHQSDSSANTDTLLQTCKDSLDTAYTLDLSTADPALRLERCCTAVVTDVLFDITMAREMWTQVCKARRECTEAWVLSAEFEKAHGSEANARRVYRHASQRLLDNPERLFDKWITFEYGCGSLPDICSAGHAINLQRHLIQRRAERERRANLFPAADGSAEAKPGQKRQRATSQDCVVEPELQTVSTTDAASSNNVLYVSNLPPSFGPQDVESLLGGRSSVSKVTMFEAKRDTAPQGQARVELSTTDALIAALDKNGLKINGHFVSIHTFKPNRQTRDTAKTATIEVRGFSPETSNKKIEQVAKKTGVPVRVHRSRLGDVVFVVMRLQEAQRAADALNGCSIDNCTLEACIANADKNAAGPVYASAVTGPAPPAVPVMVPRKTAAARRPTKKVALSAALSATPHASSAEKAQRANAKSNADFRQLLLGQKPPDEGSRGV
ncbi:Splicing factor [Coemansia sp. BCRC 34962]|nr:Splicing factor [Coemansia sp. BCRC 34962]